MVNSMLSALILNLVSYLHLMLSFNAVHNLFLQAYSFFKNQNVPSLTVMHIF